MSFGVSVDAFAVVSVDVPIDVSVDASVDVPINVSVDASVDVPIDVSVDASVDVPIDVSHSVSVGVTAALLFGAQSASWADIVARVSPNWLKIVAIRAISSGDFPLDMAHAMALIVATSSQDCILITSK